jgi:hypothetical protein
MQSAVYFLAKSHWFFGIFNEFFGTMKFFRATACIFSAFVVYLWQFDAGGMIA